MGLGRLLARLRQVGARRIKAHRRRIRHVERADCARHIEARKRGDRLARLLPQSLALGAEDERDLVGRKRRFELGRAFRIKPDGLEAGLVQFAECVGEVPSPRSGRCAPAPPTPIWQALRFHAGCGEMW